MSKGLEVLERLVNALLGEDNYYKQFSGSLTIILNDKETIEKELKEKDELARALSIITCENGDLLKYKKALEIIKKFVNIDMLMFKGEIEQEEYDLLKEVLI